MTNHLTASDTDPVPPPSPAAEISVDFEKLRLRRRPNDYLMLPSGFESAAVPHAKSPVFGTPMDVLARDFKAMARAQPRTILVEADPIARQFTFLQRTLLFRFPDLLTVQLFSAGPGRSTLAVYSRSMYGYWDLGVNRARVWRWIEALRARSGPYTSTSSTNLARS